MDDGENSMTWTGWTLKIGNKVLKDIQPLALEYREKIEEFSSGMLWWKKAWSKPTGKWEIKLIYNNGPLTPRRTEYIQFNTEAQAKHIFNQLFIEIFAEQKHSVTDTVTNNKPKNNKPTLNLV